jgi:hypothetical protein
MQNEGLGQETLYSWAEENTPGKLRVVGVQVEPFHCSTSGPVPFDPAAMQKLVLVQETPDRVLAADPAVAWTTLHALPFHCSMSGA